jgi:2-hydroxychromene-2-carboxylate isomerase
VADELGRQREFGLAAFRKAFVESRLLSEVPNVLAAAADAGLDPDEIAAGIQREDVKERLKQNTTEALERGVTGIPTVAIGDELFWGDDHLEEAASVTKQLRGLTP